MKLQKNRMFTTLNLLLPLKCVDGARALSAWIAVLMTATLVAPAVVHAQGFTMMSPMPPRYGIGAFEYTPPGGDGWREVQSGPDHFAIVYAEQTGEDTINTRMEFSAQSFPLEDPSIVPDTFRLALASFETRKAERGESLVAHSNVEYLEGTEGILMYSLVTRAGDKDIYEIFYVQLKPDKTAYLSAKFLTRDFDYDQQPYYKPFLMSLPSLKPVGSVEAADNQKAGAGEKNGAAETPDTGEKKSDEGSNTSASPE